MYLHISGCVVRLATEDRIQLSPYHHISLVLWWCTECSGNKIQPSVDLNISRSLSLLYLHSDKLSNQLYHYHYSLLVLSTTIIIFSVLLRMCGCARKFAITTWVVESSMIHSSILMSFEWVYLMFRSVLHYPTIFWLLVRFAVNCWLSKMLLYVSSVVVSVTNSKYCWRFIASYSITMYRILMSEAGRERRRNKINLMKFNVEDNFIFRIILHDVACLKSIFSRQTDEGLENWLLCLQNDTLSVVVFIVGFLVMVAW